MQKSMKIRNIGKFTKSLAKDVCYHLDITMKELNQYMSFAQAKNLVKDFCTQGEDGGYNITRDDYHQCATDMQSWIIGFEVARMASDGQFECYVHEDGILETKSIGGDNDLA